MLLQLGVPSFSTVLHNGSCRFLNRQTLGYAVVRLFV